MKFGSIKNLVNGTFAESADGSWITVSNPAKHKTVVGRVPAMSKTDLDAVFTAAEAGAKVWRATGLIQRGQVLLAAATAIRLRSAELVDIIVGEMGKTSAEATGEVTKTAEFFEYYGGMARLPYGEYLADARPGTFTSQLREPVGVTLLITPWNDPLLTPARKLAPALLAGNAVVLKPATATPLIALTLAQILHAAGLPAGVLGTVTGQGAEIGDRLVSYPAIKALSFTGSTAVGTALRKNLAGRNIRVQTEMGGKNAVVVLNDADLKLAIPAIVAGAFAQAGQRCTATSRLIVQHDIEADLVEGIQRAMEALRIGAGDQPGVDLGPVISVDAQASIEKLVAGALRQGATTLATTSASDGLAHGGSFVDATFLRVTDQCAIWREEVFGPVLSMLVVDTPEDAIAAVNDSTYGLSSAIFTRDLERAFQFVEAVDTGQVSVNQPTTGWDIHHPFGGFNDSGSPFKEQGLIALSFYSRTKTAAIRTH